MYDVAIIGAGLAGLVSSILLSRTGLHVALFERKNFPFHKVCGEYVSNEAAPFLKQNDLYPYHLNPAQIDALFLSSIIGNSCSIPLDSGGFGVSRFAYDSWLMDEARKAGVNVFEGTNVESIHFLEDRFRILVSPEAEHTAHFVIGSHGKRSRIDQSLGRAFMAKKSPYVGVKYHFKGDLHHKTIYLHNFMNGYCGAVKIEHDEFNLCYLIHRDMIRHYGSLQETETEVLCKNPHLARLFKESEFLSAKPEVINEVSFEAKEPVHKHVLMIGDAAGTIAPLSGNGMANAVRSASILSNLLVQYFQSTQKSRGDLEIVYARLWKRTFSSRLFIGRQVQRLFGSGRASEMAVLMGTHLKPLARALIRKTHGRPF